jgi:hypothetical protein
MNLDFATDQRRTSAVASPAMIAMPNYVALPAPWAGNPAPTQPRWQYLHGYAMRLDHTCAGCISYAPFIAHVAQKRDLMDETYVQRSAIAAQLHHSIR